MTERLYYADSYLKGFRARVVDRTPDLRHLYLDRTAFYPASGGQPFDTGAINGVRVLEVVDEGDRIAHLTDAPLDADEVECRIDWERRFDHMQQHSGQHLLSAVMLELHKAPTVSFHLGSEVSTIDVDAGSLSSEQIRAAEQRANELVFENRPLSVSYHDDVAALDLRKQPGREGTLRIVSIERLDHSACGGTHVRATGEIGAVLLRRTEKVRNTLRIEFLCGDRAIRRAREDYESLGQVARAFSSPLDQVPALVAAQAGELQQLQRSYRKLAAELAELRGRDLYANTPPDSEGFRRVRRRLTGGSIDESLRGLAQSFTSQPKALFLIVLEDPPSLLLATSVDSGVHAGNILKAVLAQSAGRGGGSATMAQGSVPNRDALLSAVLPHLERELRF